MAFSVEGVHTSLSKSLQVDGSRIPPGRPDGVTDPKQAALEVAAELEVLFQPPLVSVDHLRKETPSVLEAVLAEELKS
jgi:hypothetical protein